MKAKTAEPSFINDATRCRHLTANGRCRMPAVDSATNLCFDHARKALQARQEGDFARYLTRDSSGFQTAQGINHSLADLYTLLAHGHISARRASVLAFVASLLLRSLPAIDKDSSPEAHRPINLLETPVTVSDPCTDNASRSKQDCPSSAIYEPPASASVSPSNAIPSATNVESAAPSDVEAPASRRRESSSEPAAGSHQLPAVGPGTKPLPATAAEFAARILDRNLK